MEPVATTFLVIGTVTQQSDGSWVFEATYTKEEAPARRVATTTYPTRREAWDMGWKHLAQIATEVPR